MKAGDVIRDHIGNISYSRILSKGPADYVTEIDRKSEDLITELIRRRFPDHHIMAEESATSGLGEEVTWIIDPLDGTTNFIHGFPFVAVSIAASVKKEVVLGFVLDPIREELFTASRGQGAFLNGARMNVRNTFGLDEALVATGFPFRAKHLLEPYLNTFKSVFKKVSGIRRTGSAALDLAYVAAGRVDGFWEAGLKPWDIAAGSLLILEAGGCVDDFWGERNYLQTGHIVAGTPPVHSFLLEKVNALFAPALEEKE